MSNQMLFTAELDDGSIYCQNPQDKSIYGGSNCFSDIKDKNVKKFRLSGNGHTYSLDLIFGSLIIDNNPPIWPPVEIYPGMPIKLIYFQVTQQKLNKTFEVQKRKGLLGLFNVENKIDSNNIGYILGYSFPKKNGKTGEWTIKIQSENK